MRNHQRRHIDFRRGKRLGPHDRLVQWEKPIQRPKGCTKAVWNRLPDTFTLRAVQIQINVPGFTGPFSMLLSNNAATGGTCFGDSGGPNFYGDSNVVAGITSFGINGNCAGTGGVFRTDKQDVHDFVSGVLAQAD